MKRFRNSFVLVASMAVVHAAEGDGHSLIEANEKQLFVIERAFNDFKADCGRYPFTSEGLRALIWRPASIPEKVWHGPYVSEHAVPKDPFNGEYVYTCPGAHNRSTFDLYSCGEDGITRSAGADRDDFNNWDKSRSWRNHYRGEGAFVRDDQMLVFRVMAAVVVCFAVTWLWRGQKKQVQE